jgi:REP element-mobilizing transposase RayT
MPTKSTIPYTSGMFFITFTCYNWLPLIDKVKGYDIIYNWFNHLIVNGHYINGYVIMPNHVHAVISFVKTNQSISTIIGNGKRFMAYEIVKRLTQNGEVNLLEHLANNVEAKRKQNNKQHEVWELSFDWKECRSNSFTAQKINYIHNNPCSGKWMLAKIPIEYKHSSAMYYETGKQEDVIIKKYTNMEDVAFITNE